MFQWTCWAGQQKLPDLALGLGGWQFVIQSGISLTEGHRQKTRRHSLFRKVCLHVFTLSLGLWLPTELNIKHIKDKFCSRGGLFQFHD